MSETSLKVKTEDNDDVALETESEKPANTEPAAATPEAGKSLSVSVRSLTYAAVVALLVVAVGVLAWLYIGAQNKLDAPLRVRVS